MKLTYTLSRIIKKLYGNNMSIHLQHNIQDIIFVVLNMFVFFALMTLVEIILK
jgi:hypothetical protein